MRDKFKARRGPRRSLVVLGLALLCAGCGSRGTVSGKVFYRGEPLTGGTVTFVPEGGAGPVSGAIGQDGSYTVAGVRPGPMKIAVFLPSPEVKNTQKLPADVPEQAAKMFASRQGAKNSNPAESSFSDPSKSGLTYTVTSGKQTFDIQLK